MALAHSRGLFDYDGRVCTYWPGFAQQGKEQVTVRQLLAPAFPPLHGFYDECLKVEVPFSLGFMKPSPKNPFGHPGAFGAPGAGGSLGFADPHAGIGYGYVPNRMRTYLEDPRERALRTAMYRSIGETPPFQVRGTEESVLQSTTS
jgi:CubicO group peptidase (beta-lactamase class C family)